MSDLAPIPQIPPCPVTDEVLNLGFEAAYNQLNLTMRRISGDDLDRRAIENCIAALEQIQADFVVKLNYETDTYNALMDAFDLLQAQLSELSPLKNEIDKIRLDASERIEEAEDALKLGMLELEGERERLKGEREALQTDLLNAQLSLKAVMMQFDTYKRKNPERLHAEISEKSKEISRLRAERKDSSKARQELQQKLNIADREVTKGRNERARVEGELSKITALHNHLKERVDFHDGRESVKEFILLTKDGSEVGCYIYSYHFGLSIFEKIRGPSLELADFHFQIRTAMMLAMDVVPGIWGNPIFECLPGLVDIWNPAINDELHDRIMARLALDFPRLHRRILDAMAAPVTELQLPAKTLSVLSKAGYETVQQIAAELPFELTKIKGVGEQTAEEILAAINSWCIAWSRKNGEVENTRSNRVMPRRP